MEFHRALTGWPMDLKLGVRMLVKSPGLTIIAVIAMAVAIGAGAAYLQFVNGMIRPSLAFPGGDRLVGIIGHDLEKNVLDPRLLSDFRTWRAQLKLIENLGASQAIAGDVITDDGRAEPADGVRITAWAFDLVPGSPLIGRPLVDADEDASAAPVAVIGEALWQSRFNRDPQILGRIVTIANVQYTIVGVMPKSFGFPVNQNLWTPFRDSGAPIARGEGPALSVFGHLAPGVTLAAAQAELAAVTARAGAANAESRLRPEVKAYVPSLSSALDLNTSVLVLYAANLVFLALLALCAANVATLVFGRTVVREAEITVRTALGASRGRVVSQLVAEAMVLATVGAGVGLAFARVALRLVRRAWETGQGSAMPFWWNEHLTGETFLYTALLVVIASLMIGAIPALKATGPEMQSRLKNAGAGSTMTFGRLWTSIIVTQVAVTVVFLLSVGALARTGLTIEQQYYDVAFDRSEYLVARFASNTDSDPKDATTTYRHRDEFLRRLRDVPAVANATYATQLPGADPGAATDFEFEKTIVEVQVPHIGPGFFETFNRAFVAGRGFTLGEIESGANVAIVDESFARFALGGRPAVGQQVREPRLKNGEVGPWIEIVGVITDTSTSARKNMKDAHLYRPIGARPPGPVTLVIHARPAYRTDGLGPVATALREAATDAPPGIGISNARAMNAGGEDDVVGYLFTALGIIGAVALLLSTAGIYALISFTLARRTREIGIRMALGAPPGRIISGILSKALWQIGLGVLAGVVPGGLMVGAVSDVSGRNGWADGINAGLAVAAFVLIVAALSCAAPLRRALRVDPTEALRVS